MTLEKDIKTFSVTILCKESLTAIELSNKIVKKFGVSEQFARNQIKQMLADCWLLYINNVLMVSPNVN